jgi:hypothetical protein
MAPARSSKVERRGVRGARGLDHGLVFGRVLVGLEQDLVELVADRRRAAALASSAGPGGDLRLHLLLLLDGGQRLLHDLGRRLAEAPLARAAEVVRRLEQRSSAAACCSSAGLVAEILGAPGRQSRIPPRARTPRRGRGRCPAASALRLGDQFGRLRLLELQQDVGALDLDALAAFELHLRRRFGLRQHAAGRGTSRLLRTMQTSPGLSHAPSTRQEEARTSSMWSLEVGQRVVAAFQQLDARAGVARRHLAPVEHLVALGDDGERVSGRGSAPCSSARSSSMNSGSKKNRSAGSCQDDCSPMCRARSRAGSTAGLSSTERQPVVPRRGWRRSRPATSRPRPCDLRGQSAMPSITSVDGLARRGRQLRAPPLQVRGARRHALARPAAPWWTGRGAEAVQVQQVSGLRIHARKETEGADVAPRLPGPGNFA